jgi:hypothetical protein
LTGKICFFEGKKSSKVRYVKLATIMFAVTIATELYVKEWLAIVVIF